MATIVWPIERMAAVLGGRVTQGQAGAYTIRLENRELGIKLKLDVDPSGGDIRVVLDRLSSRRPTFVASLALRTIVGVEIGAEVNDVHVVSADGQRLAISAACTVQLYRPV